MPSHCVLIDVYRETVAVVVGLEELRDLLEILGFHGKEEKEEEQKKGKEINLLVMLEVSLLGYQSMIVSVSWRVGMNRQVEVDELEIERSVWGQYT